MGEWQGRAGGCQSVLWAWRGLPRLFLPPGSTYPGQAAALCEHRGQGSQDLRPEAWLCAAFVQIAPRPIAKEASPARGGGRDRCNKASSCSLGGPGAQKSLFSWGLPSSWLLYQQILLHTPSFPPSISSFLLPSIIHWASTGIQRLKIPNPQLQWNQNLIKISNQGQLDYFKDKKSWVLCVCVCTCCYC